jgi:hypothetical protein
MYLRRKTGGLPPNESRLSGGRAARLAHDTCTTSGQLSSHTVPRAARARPLQALVRQLALAARQRGGL